MSESENNMATAADFKAARELKCNPAERVALPGLGKAVLLRRPTPEWFMFHQIVPAALAARASRRAPDGKATQEESIASIAFIHDLLIETFVAPRLSLSPGPGEISPDLIDDGDLKFVIDWATGAASSDGTRLDTFRGKPAVSPGSERG